MDLRAKDIKASFIMGNKEQRSKEEPDSNVDLKESFQKKPFSELIIIRQNNRYYLYWRTINTLCCLTSSYFYAYMAAFKEAAEDVHLTNLNLSFETIFLISMVLQFLVEYKEIGQPHPVRDL